jgi:hypothetical protein
MQNCGLPSGGVPRSTLRAVNPQPLSGNHFAATVCLDADSGAQVAS